MASDCGHGPAGLWQPPADIRSVAYEFDFGDSWLRLCTVGEQRIDPEEQLGLVPARPTPYWGWGVIPDQYGRLLDSDDGESQPPSDTRETDLPPIGPWQRQQG